MAAQSMGLGESLQNYLLEVSLDEPEACRILREHTQTLSAGVMISSPEQVQMLLLLFKLMDAGMGLEIGTFTGYTSLRLTLGIADLQMTCCDVSDEYTAIAREHWQGAGVAERIDLRLAPAQQTLAAMLADGRHGYYDFAYIDADKSGYKAYVEACFSLVRSGGLIAIDNVLWGGAVADAEDTSEDTCALRELNRWLHQQAPGRFDLSLVPIGDGLTLLRLF